MENNNLNNENDTPQQTQTFGSPPLEQPVQQQQPLQPPQHDFNPQPQQQPLPTQPLNQQPYQQSPVQQTDTLGIISIVMAFLIPIVGFILGLVGRSKAKKAGYSGKLSLIGIILSIVFMIFGFILLVTLVLANFQGAQTTARDIQTKTNLNAVYQNLEVFYNTNQYYPEELNIADFQELDPTALDAVKNEPQYKYEPSDCQQSRCRSFILSAELESEDSFGNTAYIQNSLN